MGSFFHFFFLPNNFIEPIVANGSLLILALFCLYRKSCCLVNFIFCLQLLVIKMDGFILRHCFFSRLLNLNGCINVVLIGYSMQISFKLNKKIFDGNGIKSFILLLDNILIFNVFGTDADISKIKQFIAMRHKYLKIVRPNCIF